MTQTGQSGSSLGLSLASWVRLSWTNFPAMEDDICRARPRHRGRRGERKRERSRMPFGPWSNRPTGARAVDHFLNHRSQRLSCLITWKQMPGSCRSQGMQLSVCSRQGRVRSWRQGPLWGHQPWSHGSEAAGFAEAGAVGGLVEKHLEVGRCGCFLQHQ